MHGLLLFVLTAETKEGIILWLCYMAYTHVKLHLLAFIRDTNETQDP